MQNSKLHFPAKLQVIWINVHSFFKTQSKNLQEDWYERVFLEILKMAREWLPPAKDQTWSKEQPAN